MPEEKFLTAQLHELLAYLGQNGVVTIMTVTQSGMIGAMQSPVDTTYLADNVILFRFFEARGQVRRAVSVVKKRSGKHELTIRELEITRTRHSNWRTAERLPRHPHRRADVRRQAIRPAQAGRPWPIESRPTNRAVLLLPPTRRDADAIGKLLQQRCISNARRARRSPNSAAPCSATAPPRWSSPRNRSSATIGSLGRMLGRPARLERPARHRPLPLRRRVGVARPHRQIARQRQRPRAPRPRLDVPERRQLGRPRPRSAVPGSRSPRSVSTESPPNCDKAASSKSSSSAAPTSASGPARCRSTG